MPSLSFCTCRLDRSLASLMMPKVSNKNRKRASTNAIWPRLCVCKNFFSLSFLWHSIEIKCFVRNFIEFFHILLVDVFGFVSELSINNRSFDMKVEFVDWRMLMGVRVHAHVISAFSINVCHVCIVVFISFVGFGYCFLFIKMFCAVHFFFWLIKKSIFRILRSVFLFSFSLASSYSSKAKKKRNDISFGLRHHFY